MSFSLDKSPEILQRGECRPLMRAVSDPIFKWPLVWKVCPKPLPDPTLLECLAVNFRVRLSGRQERQRLQTREVARKMRR